MQLRAILDDIETDSFHFDLLLAATVMFFWLRFLGMLRSTETFGPLIVIMIKMAKSMMRFFVLFFI
jgi:hypothetical protein